MKISVVIATFKHNKRDYELLKLLASLLSQNQEFIGEIIVIDNGISISQNTKKLMSEKSVLFIGEPIIGLSRARNVGIREAKYEIISFLDDDVVVDSMWSTSIIHAFKNNEILCVGGAIIDQHFDKNRPNWLTPYFSKFLFNRIPPKSNFQKSPYYAIGANMSFKRRIFEDFGLFEEELGRKGRCLLSGEDTEFIGRLPQNRVWLETNCIVYGNIPCEKMTRRYMLKRIFWQGITDSIFIQKLGLDKFYDVDEIFFSKNFLRFFLVKIKNFYFFELLCVFVRIIGFSYGKIKMRTRNK